METAPETTVSLDVLRYSWRHYLTIRTGDGTPPGIGMLVFRIEKPYTPTLTIRELALEAKAEAERRDIDPQKIINLPALLKQ
jgi:hypothetical protein